MLGHDDAGTRQIIRQTTDFTIVFRLCVSHRACPGHPRGPNLTCQAMGTIDDRYNDWLVFHLGICPTDRTSRTLTWGFKAGAVYNCVTSAAVRVTHTRVGRFAEAATLHWAM